MLQSRIRRGELDRKITFLKKIVGENITNEDETEGWEEIDSNPSVWAKVVQKGGRELVVADQIRVSFQTLFVVDWRDDLKEEYRIAHAGKVYDINGIIEHEESRKRYLQIIADVIPNIEDTWSS
jgi:SPP1 family predicted phage head-tail adaptor